MCVRARAHMRVLSVLCVHTCVCVWSGDYKWGMPRPSLSAGGLGSRAARLSGAVGSVHSQPRLRDLGSFSMEYGN